MRTFDALYDEDHITRPVVANIWHGDLRNNWKYAGVPPPYNIDCYNFSSYLYADALFSGPPKRNSLRLDRWFSALTGTAGIFLFYLAALRLFDLQTALFSLFTMAVLPILIQDGHYARPEGFVTLLTGAVYLLSIHMHGSRYSAWLLAAGSFCCGLLIACKISMIPLAAIPLVCLIAERRGAARFIGIWIAGTAAGTFIGVPDAFFHPAAFWNGVQMLRHQYAGVHVPFALIDGSNSFLLCGRYFWQTFGPLLCIFCLAGIVVLAKRRQYLCLMLVVAPLFFYLVFFSSNARSLNAT